MDEGLTIESFAEQMQQAAQPEHPSADSGAADEQLPGEGQSADEATEEAQATEEQQSDQPESESEPEAERVIKWTTANGESLEATESELKAGYLRQQDYTRKTQDVAEQARQSQAKIQKDAQDYLAAVSHFNEGIAYIGGLKAQIQGLRAQNLPAADLEVQLMRAEQQLGGALQHFRGTIEAREQARIAASVSEAEQHLTTVFPNITRDDVVKVFTNLQKKGATQDEIELIRTHPRLAEMAVLASRQLELQAKKPEVANKVKKLPPATVASRPAAPSTKTDAVLKAVNSRRTFTTAEFGQLLRAAR